MSHPNRIQSSEETDHGKESNQRAQSPPSSKVLMTTVVVVYVTRAAAPAQSVAGEANVGIIRVGGTTRTMTGNWLHAPLD